MKFKTKPISEQVFVITGASSGIGLATAKMAAKHGAHVVLSSRNENDLNKIVNEIRDQKGIAYAVVADVTKPEELMKLKNEALEVYGHIDTWVNNAGVSIYGDILDIPLEEEKALFETNFWGVRHGCHAAIEAFKNKGGVLINLGSEVSQRAIPLQGMYSASKHAVKGYTDALRIELEKKGLPIEVCLIRPAGIDTPYTEHAKNHLKEGAPSLPAPVYNPEIVARAILSCAVQPRRDIYIGGASKLYSLMDSILPTFADKMLEVTGYKGQEKGSKLEHTEKNEGLMHAPEKEGKERGGHKGHVMNSSLYTTLSKKPWKTTLAVTGAALATGSAALMLFKNAKTDNTKN